MALLPAPTKQHVLDAVLDSYYWVRRSRKPAPQTSGQAAPNLEAISMYRSPPITFKVPDGYTIPGATNICQYVRHLGNQMVVNGSVVPQVAIRLYFRRWNESFVELKVTDWADGQPELRFDLLRTYNPTTGKTKVDIAYYGKPSGDTRQYPIQMYWGQALIMSDHRTQKYGWFYSQEWNSQIGQRGNKFFLRTEDIVAAKLLWDEPDNYKLLNWCNQQWGNDIEADIHAPLFNMANGKRTDFIYQTGAPTYRDCVVQHDGCPNWWPADRYRGASTSGWGFSHRSKVCFWEGGYTWILAQDPLGLQCQAIMTLNKVGNPDHQFFDAWPFGVPGKPTMTPKGVATWVKNNYYRENVGATMWGIPVIGGDDRISSLRTNQFLVLTTLLGYKYRVAGWAAYADELANILLQVQVGGKDQPAHGAKTAELGEICRPDYTGSQLYVWDKLDGSGTMSNNQVSAAGVDVEGLGLKDFGWLRQTINHYFNLPLDDEDFTLSTIETTATYCQALRVYLWHKYRVLWGSPSTIPGY